MPVIGSAANRPLCLDRRMAEISAASSRVAAVAKPVAAARRRGPDFLCIGASRCGTTWLHENLAAHPQLWLPPVKELRYFDMFKHRDWNRLPLVLRDPHSRQRAHRFLSQQVKSYLRGGYAEDTMWALRYFLLPPGNRWYRSLFPTGRKLRGECSPTYARLPSRAIRRVRNLLPDVKLIYLCRNPVHRDWSLAALRLDRKRGVGIDQAEDLQVMGALKRIGLKESSNYLAHLERWEEFFPRDRIFVGFYDEVRETPEELLLRIFEFLGADASPRHVHKQVRRAVGAQSYGAIPERYARLLSERYHDQVVRLHERFGNVHTQVWLDYVTQHAGSR